MAPACHGYTVDRRCCIERRGPRSAAPGNGVGGSRHPNLEPAVFGQSRLQFGKCEFRCDGQHHRIIRSEGCLAEVAIRISKPGWAKVAPFFREGKDSESGWDGRRYRAMCASPCLMSLSVDWTAASAGDSRRMPGGGDTTRSMQRICCAQNYGQQTGGAAFILMVVLWSRPKRGERS
jgi:hypothetical protein